MPGGIIDTNGEVTGTGVVTWTDEEHTNVSDYRVTSEQTSVEHGQSGSGFGPGCGVAAAVVGLLSGVLLISRARNRANS